MGEKLMKYYKFVSDEGGMSAKVKLAAATKVPSTQAALEPDSPQILQAFRDAVQQITGRPAPMY